MPAAVSGERVEEGVGGRVVTLTRAAENAGGRREQHERGQIGAAGQLVQMPGGVGLGRQHVVEPLRGERRDDTVVDDARGVHDRGQRVLGGDRGEQVGQCRPLGHVGGGDRHRCAEGREAVPQLFRPGGRETAPAGEQQVTHAVTCHQVTGEQSAERPGTTRDQDGAVGVERRWC